MWYGPSSGTEYHSHVAWHSNAMYSIPRPVRLEYQGHIGRYAMDNEDGILKPYITVYRGQIYGIPRLSSIVIHGHLGCNTNAK